MPTTTFNPTKNITCFDLENTTWENLYFHALYTGLCVTQIDFLKEQFEEVQLKKNSLQEVFIKRVYADGNTIFLGATISNPSEVAPFMDFHLNTILPIHCSPTLQREILESITLQSGFHFSEATFYALEQVNKNHNGELRFSFQQDFISLDLSHLSLTLFDLEQKFNVELAFCDELPSIITHSLELNHLYFKNRVPVAYGFKQRKSYIQHIAWSVEFIQSVLAIQPVNKIRIDKEKTLNIILDKISATGLEQLNEAQKNFLASF